MLSSTPRASSFGELPLRIILTQGTVAAPLNSARLSGRAHKYPGKGRLRLKAAMAKM